MPTLFISYKRGTAAVAPLMDKLREAHYRLWFDRDEIHLGDPDWQARIDQGLALCDGVILNITPAACASEPVRYEVKKARKLHKPIFPIIVEHIADRSAAIRDLGLPERAQIEDFTDVTKWDEQIQQLLRDLEKKHLRVTLHDRRQQRDRNNPKYILHQTYLKQLVERIGTLNLSQINPEQARSVNLEDIYVDSPTGLSISVEINNWHVINWDVVSSTFQTTRFSDVPDNYPKSSVIYPRPPFETLIGKIDEQIASYRKKHPDASPYGSSWSTKWNNGVHDSVTNLHLKHLAAALDRLVIWELLEAARAHSLNI